MNAETAVLPDNLKISEKALRRMVEFAVKDIEGVKSFSKSRVRFGDLFLNNRNSAVSIRAAGDNIDVGVSIIVSSGSKVKNVAEAVQKKIKDEILNITGITVTRVNVIADGIFFEPEENQA